MPRLLLISPPRERAQAHREEADHLTACAAVPAHANMGPAFDRGRMRNRSRAHAAAALRLDRVTQSQHEARYAATAPLRAREATR